MPTINAQTGKLISGIDEAFQSLRIALRTQRGTRIMRRDYGSDRASFVDRGVHPNNLIDFYAEIAEAIRLEPRFRLVTVRLSEDSDIENGRTIFDLEVIYYPRGHLGDFSEVLTASGPVVWNEGDGAAAAA